MNRHIYRLVAAVLAAITIVSCNDARKSETYRLLEDVDSYIEARPDSALAVLEGIDKSELTSKELEAKYALLLSQALDKNYIDLQSDSIIAPAVRYYENHGSEQEKFQTQYYLARIYQNSNDYENAMKSIVKAEGYDFDEIDHSDIGRLYSIKTDINIVYYSTDDAIESIRQELKYYKSGGHSNNYHYALSQMITWMTDKHQYDSARFYLDIAKREKPGMRTDRIVALDNAELQYIFHTKDGDPISHIDSMIQKYGDHKFINWKFIAHVYNEYGYYDKALEALGEFNKSQMDDKSRMAYHILKSRVHACKQEYLPAYDALLEYVALSDSADYALLHTDTRFIEERYANEISRIQAQNTKTTIILVSIIALMAAGLTIWRIRIKLQERTAEKKQLEIEKQRYEAMYSEAVTERDALTKMIEENTVNEGTKVIIERRLELLNKVIVSYITDTSAANRKANEELEALVSDRDMFITSTRMTLESSHPAFFRYLREKELTDWEINYCCLYLIGLKGKDIGEYINLKRHYTYGSVIRQKLGLTENDTNLSIHLKKLLENPRA